MLLKQQDVDLYSENWRKTALGSENSIQVFKEWTDFYNDYKLSLLFDFNKRFRTVETPIGISDYATYNFLSIFAPELKGLWSFAPVPGFVDSSSNLKRDVPTIPSYAMVFKTSSRPDDCWDFLKWWISADVQTQFGREMESLLGSSARYATANNEALSRLPWPVKDYKLLELQKNESFGIPVVPGGYFTSRHIDNAFRTVAYTDADYRDTLL